MSEKQTDVEHALSAFGAPAIPYQKFNNGIVAPNETVTTTDHRAGTAAFPLLAASLPALSSLTLGPVAASAPVERSNTPTGFADPGARIQAAMRVPGGSSNGLSTAASASAAGEFGWPTAPRRSPEEAAGPAAHYGKLPIAELFKVLGAAPAPHSPTPTPACGDLRQVFRMLDRTD